MEKTLKSPALDLGADRVGIASQAVLEDGPPSAGPRYLLPGANAVVSFAVSLNPHVVGDFISKRAWRPHCEERKGIARKLYGIGDVLVEYLRSKGHEAVNVDLNNSYRPEENAADITETAEFHPDFSHRYAALTADLPVRDEDHPCDMC